MKKTKPVRYEEMRKHGDNPLLKFVKKEDEEKENEKEKDNRTRTHKEEE